jgi:hypothetical protein
MVVMKKTLISLSIPLVMLLTYHESIRLSRIVVEGTVLTEGSLQPVVNAFVYTVPGEEETLTDKNGKFKLTTWQPMPLAITVEHGDFTTTSIKITSLPANQCIRLKRK